MSRLKDLTKIDLFLELTDDIVKRSPVETNIVLKKRFEKGKVGKVIVNKHLFYVLGALIGDGCTFKYPINQHQVMLAGSKEFMERYSLMLNLCSDKNARIGKDGKHDSWYAKTNNFELYALFSRVRADTYFLRCLLEKHGDEARLLFIEGFFDAEGCVKIIKEPVRLTPKICPDFTSTNYGYLTIVQKLLRETLNIEAKFSSQAGHPLPDGRIRRRSHHLRIYKKEYVRLFFENLSTTKLNAEKIGYVNKWLELNTTCQSPLRKYLLQTTN